MAKTLGKNSDNNLVALKTDLLEKFQSLEELVPNSHKIISDAADFYNEIVMDLSGGGTNPALGASAVYDQQKERAVNGCISIAEKKYKSDKDGLEKALSAINAWSNAQDKYEAARKEAFYAKQRKAKVQSNSIAQKIARLFRKAS